MMRCKTQDPGGPSAPTINCPGVGGAPRACSALVGPLKRAASQSTDTGAVTPGHHRVEADAAGTRLRGRNIKQI